MIGQQERWQIWHPTSSPPPAEERCQHYCHPGKSALEVAGMTTEGCSYLDALEV